MSTPFDDKIWMRLSTCETPEDEADIQLKITIDECETVTIEQVNSTPTQENIWLDACNIYYDREFNAIRGDINTYTKAGESSSFFGKHFIIFYVGKMGINGSSRLVSIEFYDKKEIYTPTFVLIHRYCEQPPKVMMSYRGSWKADDAF